MNKRKVSIGLLTLALSCGVASFANAQDGPPPPPPPGYGPSQNGGPDMDHHDNPGFRAGFHAGFDNGRKDGNDHHRFNPERAFRRNGRPEYRNDFGPRDEFYRGFHDGFIKGYDRGYHGGDIPPEYH